MQSRLRYLIQSQNKLTYYNQLRSYYSQLVEIIPEKEGHERFNEFGIQMINENLRKYLFGDKQVKNNDNIEKALKHLQSFDLLNKNTDRVKDLDNLKLPKLYGKNLEEHFQHIGRRQTARYTKIATSFIVANLPEIPKRFKFEAGWTKYENGKENGVKVDYPDEDTLVFDVEVLVSAGNLPTLAAAVSKTAWYTWCSERLIANSSDPATAVTLNDLIPLETPNNEKENRERIVICHNAGFDRSFVKEQYFLEKTKLRFLDTMCMHIACNGFTSEQRSIKNTFTANKQDETMTVDKMIAENRKNKVPNFHWMKTGSLNSLYAVHELYCNKKERMKKDLRDTFVKGTMSDIENNFQSLMEYCANDVVATFDVLQKLYPLYIERFPHPVTLSGMLEMGTMYLPINKNWRRYIENCKSEYETMEYITKNSLMKSANEACEFLHDNKYKDDPWLFDLDWSCRELKMKKTVKKRVNVLNTNESNDTNESNPFYKILDSNQKENIIKNKVELHDSTIKRFQADQLVPDNMNSVYCQYPKWYLELFDKIEETYWQKKPTEITSRMRIAPKLLRLKWDGYPMYYHDKHGWGYLVPKLKNIQPNPNIDEAVRDFPYNTLVTQIVDLDKLKTSDLHAKGLDKIEKKIDEIEKIIEDLKLNIEKNSDNLGTQKIIYLENRKQNFLKKRNELKETIRDMCPYHIGSGPVNDVHINGCYFFRIPHKDGAENKVGNPLAKGFLSKVLDGLLNSHYGDYAQLMLKADLSLRYWEMNEKRITSQSVVWMLDPFDTGKEVKSIHDCNYGVILPRTSVSGTITRRAVEPTWLTASNYKEERIGSELKAMIQCPDDYYYVGADVDSQELWIASLIGDSHFASEHGCTAIGWMTLQGKKKDGTDMHSRTASLIGISRDHAKVVNYGRIYGAGKRYAEKLLLQFNPNLTQDEAKNKSSIMYDSTKGKLVNNQWEGGSESEMFNKLESIAKSAHPKTPVLNASITQSLEPERVSEDFMTSRVNWVVQSSAVDYLHLMLSCMQWLIDDFKIEARFSISIHDEIRYIVKSEDRYRIALALQITNLLTRSLFAYKLGFDDLPMQVAYFSEVDIDKCLRKDASLEFITPSNPFGLTKGYGIEKGESLDIYSIMEKSMGDLEKKQKIQS